LGLDLEESFRINNAHVCFLCFLGQFLVVKIIRLIQRPIAFKAKVDLIVTHANVRTMDLSHPTATAFAVQEGKFVHVGSVEEVMSLYEAKQVFL
jgi:hypothetical protein